MTDEEAKLKALRSTMRSFWRLHLCNYRSIRKDVSKEFDCVNTMQDLNSLERQNRRLKLVHLMRQLAVLDEAINQATEQLVAFSV